MVPLWIFVLTAFISVNYGQANITPYCGQREKSVSYLDVAMDMITKVKSSFPICPPVGFNTTIRAIDCADLRQMGYNTSGAYKVWPNSRITDEKSIDVYCDMENNGGGWTVFQRRGNFSRSPDYFYKDWQSYKNGFGNIEMDFWLGNDNIFALSNQRLYTLRIDLESFDGERRYAEYDAFWIDDESHQYTLHLGDYRGNAGDSMTQQHNNQKFSTKDVENDNQKDENCAQKYKGGWWYNTCHHSNLNGLYLPGKHGSFADGIEWHSWKGYQESMKATEMKIRATKFRESKDFATTPQRR